MKCGELRAECIRLPNLSLRGRFAPVAISGRQLRFRREYPVIRLCTARFPRRFAPRNDKSEVRAILAMERENFKSRLGFILVSAGCAIGIGNVWRFPYVAGQNGGGLFVLLYLIFLVLMGVPVLTMELAVGRASRKSAVLGYKKT